MVWGIVLGLCLLMYLSMKNWSILITAPLCAVVVALSGGQALLPAYLNDYMGGVGGFVKSWLPLFMLGSLFGKVMGDTGAAESLAKWTVKTIGKDKAILATVLATALLTYGGVSVFVVVFTVYPLALALFKEVDLPKRLIPGSIALGAFTFTETALPGSPQIQNIIPTKYFGTTAMAAPVIGIITSIFIFGAGFYYLTMRAKKAKENGETFVPSESDKQYLTSPDSENKDLPSPFISILPLATIIVTLDIVKLDIVICMLVGILIALVLMFKKIQNVMQTINIGASNSMIAILNTACAVGFGSIVKVAPGFGSLVGMMEKVSMGSALVYEAIAVNVLAGVTGSATGGIGIVLDALGTKFIESGVNPQVLHRVATLAATGLDSLPHNGAVLTLLAICGLTHKDSYQDIFVCTVVITIAACILAVILGSVGIV